MAWFAAEGFSVNADLRIQALGRLIPTDAPKVIPILRNIALEADNPGAARRAVFVLAQSRNPQAQSTVVDVAKVGPERVRVAAVRELANFGGPDVGQQLLEVYWRGNAPVRQQVLVSLGDRSDISALFRIVQTEHNDELRDTAILTLGKAGGREQLRDLFARASKGVREAVIRGLFLARDEDGLIRIAKQEKDAALKTEIVRRLRLLGTPKAKEYLESLK